MNKLSQQKEEELLRYLDGELDEQQRNKLEIEISSSVLLKSRLDELKTIQQFLLKKATLEVPSKSFTQNVMSGLEAKPNILPSTYRRGLLLMIGTILASIIALMLLSSGVFDSSTTSLVVDAPINNKWIQNITFSIPFNGKILVNGIIFLNLGLALILFDRALLRPLFQRRSMI